MYDCTYDFLQVEKMSIFKAFLNVTNGAILLHYWMGAEHLKHLLDHNDSELWNMTLLFKLESQALK